MSAKQILRKRMRTFRAALPPWRQRRGSRYLARRLLRARMPCRLSASRRLGVYCACDGEIDPAPLYRILKRRGCKIYFPVLNRFGSCEHMRFCAMRTPHAHPRTARATGRALPVQQLHALLTPLVAFDAQCERMGRGGGHYDRALNFQRIRRRPALIGIAWDEQQVSSVPTHRHDMAMDAIYTPHRRYCAASRPTGLRRYKT